MTHLEIYGYYTMVKNLFISVMHVPRIIGNLRLGYIYFFMCLQKANERIRYLENRFLKLSYLVKERLSQLKFRIEILLFERQLNDTNVNLIVNCQVVTEKKTIK